MLLESFDHRMEASLNLFVGRWPLLDRIVVLIVEAPVIKLGLPLAIIVGLWFAHENVKARSRLTANLCGVLIALFLARVLQLCLPMRLRPMHDPDIGFRLPPGATQKALEGWSSFPSDHAALAFGLSMAILMLSRRLGAVAIAWSIVIICLPRLYLGYHYPTDILGGASLGMICVVATDRLLAQRFEPAVKLADRFPQYFYPFAFIGLFLFGTLFRDLRKLGSLVLNGLA